MKEDFLSNNVNAFLGDLLICDSYVVRMFPELTNQASRGRELFTFSPESSHIDQLGFKLCTALRLGRITSLHVLTKDGSPHALQIPLIVQEAVANTNYSPEKVSFFVIEEGQVTRVSHAAVRAARHLSEIEEMMNHRPLYSRTSPTEKTDYWIAILVGGRCDLDAVRESGLIKTLDEIGLRHITSVISSEQNPEELREYCHTAASKNVSLFICIAGAVPGLPAAVKAHLPTVPVIAVPLSVRDFDARDIMLATLSVPARRPILLSGIDRNGLKKAAYLACDILAVNSPALRMRYEEFLKSNTPAPDLAVNLSQDCNSLLTLDIERVALSQNGKRVKSYESDSSVND